MQVKIGPLAMILGVGVGGIGDRVGETLGTTVGVGVRVGVELGSVVGVGLALGSTVGLGSIVGEGLGLGSSEGVGVTEGSPVGVGDKVGVGVSVGVSEGVGLAIAGSIEDWLFCGCEVVRTTKSAELSSVSSPFPANSSVPPVPILVASEAEFAFLSTLPLLSGLSIVAVSLAVAEPIPTKSTWLIPASL